MSGLRHQPTPITTCSIDGCGRAVVRRCPWCGRTLCDECWCKEETEHARRDLEQRQGTRGA